MAYKPVNIKTILSSINHISDIQFFPDGKAVIFLSTKDGIGELFKIDESGKEYLISAGFNVKGTVGYGGGGFDIHKNHIVFSEKNGDIFKVDISNFQKITKIVSNNIKTASPKISPDEKWIIFVYDQNEVSGIGISSLTGLSWPRQLVLGADFYMHPTWHPNGNMVAWSEWDHPYMPWDASRIKLGHVRGMQLRLIEEEFIDGGSHNSANQPQFSPDGKWLSYIKRNKNWDDLILYNLESQKKHTAIKGDDFHLRMPDWIQGLHSYGWASDSNTIYFLKYHHGLSAISYLNLKNKKIRSIDIKPYKWASQIEVSPVSNQGIFIGSSDNAANQIVKFNNNKIQSTLSRTKSFKKNSPIAEEITFSTEDGFNAFAWYYPPTNPKVKKENTPCIINIHSGPTSLKHPGLSAETSFFTSRGYSVVYLNYRGSVSFGYDYQYALQRKWGDAEVEDTIQLIAELEDKNMINPQKLAVMGSSAGGFSTLRIMIRYPGMFKAGICSYAVSDLVDDAINTHKFERYYHQFLTGDFATEKERFIERSPISHLEKITDPLALFHGEDDMVVSVEQSKCIYDILTKQNVPCELKVYKGEGHGFRKLKNIEYYFNSIHQFLQKHLKR